MFHLASGNCCETSTKTQQHVLKSGDKMTLYLRAPGHWCGVVNLQAQQAPGNWSEVMRFNSEGQGSEFRKMQQISDHRYLGIVFNKLRQTLHLEEGAPVLGLMFWRLFMSATMNAAVHLGPNYAEKLQSLQEHKLRPECITETAPSWTRPTLTHDHVIKWTTAKEHVSSDSTLCLGMMQEHSGANQRWKNQLE